MPTNALLVSEMFDSGATIIKNSRDALWLRVSGEDAPLGSRYDVLLLILSSRRLNRPPRRATFVSRLL